MTTAAAALLGSGQPFSEELNHRIAEEFFREGCALVPGVLSPDEVAALRERTDDYFARRDALPPGTSRSCTGRSCCAAGPNSTRCSGPW
jgi:hypothetical protein